MTTSVLLRDLDLVLLEVAAVDGRRLEVVVDGLSLFGGVQLAIDTTVCTEAGRWTQGDKSQEAPGLVWWCCESNLEEAQSFLTQLARRKARGENFTLRRRVEQAWRLR